MKKVVFTLVVLCLSLMTQSACSGKSAKAEQATEQSGEQAAGESVASQNELSDKNLGLIEDATDKVKDCTDPEKAFAIMAETSKAIDKACKDAGTSLSGWIQSLSDSELKRYEDATAKFQQAVKQ